MPTHEPPQFLEVATYPSIRYSMLDQPPLALPEGTLIERSFAGNMAKIVMDRPEVFLFTHKSAIPLADSVRGYYEALGYEVPELAVVNTKDEEGANHEYPPGTELWDQRARAYDHNRRGIVVAREVALLYPLIDGKRVAIIDQYINWRDTLQTAMEIAIKAGAVSVAKPDSAACFHEARREDIDFETLSSVHKSFFIEIGRAAIRFDVMSG